MPEPIPNIKSYDIYKLWLAIENLAACLCECDLQDQVGSDLIAQNDLVLQANC